MTEQEQADEQVYQQQLCYICLDRVTGKHVTWQLGKRPGQRFIFHDSCQRRVQNWQRRTTFAELLCVMRERREMQAQWEAK